MAHSQASLERVAAALGYRPEVGFEEGLRRTVEASASRGGKADGGFEEGCDGRATPSADAGDGELDDGLAGLA